MCNIVILTISFLFSLSLFSSFFYNSNYSSAVLIPENETYFTYQNTDLGIKITYPSNWVYQLDTIVFVNTITFFPQSQFPQVNQDQSNQQSLNSNDNSGATNINIVTWNIQNNISLVDFSKTSLQTLTKLPGFSQQEVNNKTATLSGKPAFKIIFTNNQYGIPLKQLQISTLNNTRAYVITYTSDENNFNIFLPIAEKMINSFRIT